MKKRLLVGALASAIGLGLWPDTGLWAQTAQRSPAPKPTTRPTPQPSPSAAQERVKIYSDKAIYKRQEKKAEAIGHVKIIQDNTTIYADKVLYDEKTKQSFVETGVKIVQVNKTKDKGRTTTITAEKMTAFHQQKRFIFREDARMDRDPAPNFKPPETFTDNKKEKRERAERAVEKAKTVITSDEMEYFSKTENANLVGHVVMLQKDKKITGDKAFVRGENDGDLVIVEGNAEVTQINGNWLIQNKVIKPDPEDEEQQRFLKEKLVIKADKITVFRATDDLKAEGNVKITQKVGGKERVAVGKEATFSDRQQLATLTGDVRIQRENQDWLTAERALFYTEKEAFEAIGTDQEQVVSEFTIDEEDERSSKEPINPPLPEFELDQHQPGQRLPGWLKNRQQPQRAPAKPTSPQPSAPLARPSISVPPRPPAAATPAPAQPTVKPSAAPPKPSPTPTPRPTASPTSSPTTGSAPTPVESSFTIPVD